MKRMSWLVASALIATGMTTADTYAANLDAGGAFKKPVQQQKKTRQKRQQTRKRAPAVSYDGTYAIAGVRTVKIGDVFCFETYNASITVSNGQAAHQLPFGARLYGTARGNRLQIASAPDKNGGRWAGSMSLPMPGVLGRGTLNWSGDGTRCNFTLTVTRR